MRSAPQVAYVIWILLSTVGLLQGLASHYGWAGLSFFRRWPVLGYVCAAILIPVSYYWFFSMANRNVEGLEGWQLFSRFVIGVTGGIIVVLLLSSLLNASMRGAASVDVDAGLDNLRHSTYAHLLHHAIRNAGDKEET